MLLLRNSWTPSTGSLVQRLLARRARRNDESFPCGIRVIAGEVPGLDSRWRVRRSAVDPLHDDVRTLHHGTEVTLRVILNNDAGTGVDPRPGARADHVVLVARTVAGPARENAPIGAPAVVEISVAPGDVVHFEAPLGRDRRGNR